MIYLFDIDGTLTPSRLRIDPEFEQFFLNWMKDKEVIFVTGSDKDKTIEQVGEKIWTKAQRIYQSCGNAVYQGGQLIDKKQFDMSPELEELLNVINGIKRREKEKDVVNLLNQHFLI
jgi:phosphomannomutase